jgi:hypothetical protein
LQFDMSHLKGCSMEEIVLQQKTAVIMAKGKLL